MFTKNYNEVALVKVANRTYNDASSLFTSITGQKPTVTSSHYSKSRGNNFNWPDTMTYFCDGSHYIDSNSTGYSSFYGVLFGDGTAEPTVDDLGLSGNPVVGLSSKNITYLTNDTWQPDYFERSVTYTISNTTGKDITISEIALFTSFGSQKRQYYNSEGDFTCYPVLIERTLLESPVEIPADGIGKVTYTIRMNLPI